MILQAEVFVDTWGWVAIGHPRDQAHLAVKQIFQDLRASKSLLHTSDYVLDEVMTFLFKRTRFEEAVQFMQGILKESELGQLQIHSVFPDHFFAAWELRQRYQDKPSISFTDLTSMTIRRSQNIQRVLSQDDHFLQLGMGFTRLPET